MEIKLLKKSKDMIQVEIIGSDDTMMFPLVHQLLKDENVEDCSYVTGHPDLDHPTLTVKVKDGKPQSALKKAAKALASEFSSASELISKKLG